METSVNSDEEGMRAALAWSARGRGTTSPRPSVGCVLVKEGAIVAGGHTQPGDGKPHAETAAIRAAVEGGCDLRGSTAYVTLEPCSHIGTTQPCTTALIAAGVARVVVGVRDPNPLINGRGYKALREAGIEVVEDCLPGDCASAQDHFLKFIATGVPFTTLKGAISLDGKIATRVGASKWITGTESRIASHQLRGDHDAVLVGAGTVRADNPRLTVRTTTSVGSLPEGENLRQPVRIVVDSAASLAESALDLQLFNGAGGLVIVAVTDRAPAVAINTLQQSGVQVIITTALDGRVDLAALMGKLPSLGIYSVLIEGGAAVSTSALKAGLVDKVVYFVAPILMGGDGMDVLGSLGNDQLADALRLRDIVVQPMGQDVMISGYTRALPGTKEYVHRAS